MPLEFSPEVNAKIEAIAAKYPRRGAALLPVLHLVQDEYGHLSPEVQAAVAKALDVPPTQVREVATFYEMYHEHPEGQVHLEICTNISCHLSGADRLVAHAKRALKVEVGHQTEDGAFSLMEAECLASCGSGPVMKVGLDYYEHVTEAAFDALVGRMRQVLPKLGGKHYHHAEPGPHVGPVPGFEPPRPVVPPPAEAKTEPPKPAEVKAEPPKPAEVKTEPPKPAEVKTEPPKPAEVKTEPPHTAEVKTEPPKAAAPKGEDAKTALPSFDPPPLKRPTE